MTPIRSTRPHQCRLAAFGLLLLSLACGVAAGEGVPDGQVRVTVEMDVRHQTITGFGAYAGQRRTWTRGPYATPAFVERVTRDLGVSVLREELPTSFEIENDNADPDVTELDRFNIARKIRKHHDPLAPRLAYMRAMKEAGVETFFASVWSPPPWMKHNGQLSNGTKRNSAPAYRRDPDEATNQLKRADYEEFAEMCVAYVRIVERETGIRLAALSPQNEPRFSQRYQSAVYDGEALRDLVKVIGARFEAEGITTRLIVPEDIGSLDRIRGLVMPTLEDPEARRHIGAIAVHGYAFDGVTAGSDDPDTWREMASWGSRYDLPLWMTETSGFGGGFGGAMRLATAMYTALHHGNVSLWTYWRLGTDGKDQTGLLVDAGATPTARYWISRQFFRFVRPGAVRVGVTTSAPEVLALAFVDDARDTRTVILIHVGDEPLTVSLAGLPDRRLALHRTSETESGKWLPPVAGDAAIALPPRSVSTLISEPE